jgi:acyl-ACP thioesterase
VQPADADNSQKTLRRVMYSDLDMNNHLTSMRYLDWALDCIDIDYLNTHTVQTVDINFMHETPVNEDVTLLCQQSGESYVVSGELASGKTSFSAKIGF